MVAALAGGDGAGMKRKRTEQATQIAVVRFLKLALPADCFFTAINPIPHKSMIIASLCKAMGMRAGVADLLFIYRGRTLFLEMKARSGRESDAQAETKILADVAGATTFVCRSVEDVESRLRFWGVPLKATVITALDLPPTATLAPRPA